MSRDYQLHQGDMLEVMPTLEAGSAAMVFADLPYGVTSNIWDATSIPPEKFWGAVKLCAQPAAITVLSATYRFGAKMVASNDKNFRYDLVWKKHRPTGHLSANKRPLRVHEGLLVFYARASTYNAQKTPGRPYSAGIRPVNRNLGRVDPLHRHANADGMRHPQSVLTIASDTKTAHPTQKPVALLEWLIATYTNPGDLVLDPCFGSNSTGVACARLGRRYIGIERDPTYFAAGKARLEAEVARLAEADTTSPAKSPRLVAAT